MFKHVAIWIDHKEARIYKIPETWLNSATIEPYHIRHEFPVGVQEDKSHPAHADVYFRAVAGSLDEPQEILLVGPATAKLEFLRYLHKNHHAIAAKIVGVETVDHPTDGQLVAFARKYFTHTDILR